MMNVVTLSVVMLSVVAPENDNVCKPVKVRKTFDWGYSIDNS